MNIQNSITIVSMSRRTELYSKFILDVESKIGHLIKEYIVFVNDPNILPFYKNLQNTNKKINVISGQEDFVYRFGHDRVYNYLESKVTSQYILKLFDTDLVEVNIPEFEKELNLEKDLYGILTYMSRGSNMWETKFQLYKKNIFKWEGCVHEEKKWIKNENEIQIYNLTSFRVFHKNDIDFYSKNLTKTEDGFIILEKVDKQSDSFLRNCLYEGLTWKIVNEGLDHKYRGWFLRHYEINKKVIDFYHEEAEKKYSTK